MKDIIVVADNDIGKIHRVPGQLVGTHPVVPRAFRDPLRGHHVPLPRPPEQVLQGVVDAVVMAVRPGTVRRGAFHRLEGTDAVPGTDHKAADVQPPLLQKGQCLRRGPAGHGLGGQVKDPLRLPLSQGLERGKEDGQGLSGPGRRLQKELSAMHDGPVDARRQVKLALPVDIGKLHLPQGPDGGPAAGQAQAEPGEPAPDQVPEPAVQVLIGPFLIKIPDLAGQPAAVGHADPDPFQPLLLRIDAAVAAGLGQVDLLGPLRFQGPPYGLDLIDGPDPRFLLLGILF